MVAFALLFQALDKMDPEVTESVQMNGLGFCWHEIASFFSELAGFTPQQLICTGNFSLGGHLESCFSVFMRSTLKVHSEEIKPTAWHLTPSHMQLILHVQKVVRLAKTYQGVLSTQIVPLEQTGVQLPPGTEAPWMAVLSIIGFTWKANSHTLQLLIQK